MVGLIRDGRGAWLINQRPAGKDMAGFWEFPGGKRMAGEEPLAALRRELAEELGVEVVAAEPLLELVHDYPGKRVLLDVWLVLERAGTPEAREGQRLRWVSSQQLADAGLLPADRPIVDALLALERRSA
jgi:8-oxo-dGTP diphosphatase